ncbi:MAG: peptide-methionine (S)-S-oxide reductase MsrA [Gemmatimonadota bacterium]
METATLAGGCFWCIEAVFQDLKGVGRAQSGYAGGSVAHPTYEEVCRGTTGHAEAVQVEFDPEIVTFPEILEVFFAVHDPTTLNRQGADVGTQYRSAIFFHTSKQEAEAREAIRAVEEAGVWEENVVTEVTPLETFYPAEDHHDDYYSRNPEQPYCRAVITPKLARFRSRFSHKLESHSG